MHVILDGSRLPSPDEIGGKAWSIARMRSLGLPVPPAFVLPTAVCRQYATARRLPPSAIDALRAGIAYLEEQTGRAFGARPRALLVSVRSGAPVSMPGMLDTVLDLGIDDTVEAALAAESGSAAFARDTHLRFVECYGRVVLKAFEPVAGTPDAMRAAVLADAGRPVPTDPWEQLTGAVSAVFDSWGSARARAYRRHWGIAEDLGTAVTVQAMVFGNLDDRSGTGVLFTRDPRTGADEPYGEYLRRGQGEDVVGGGRTPEPLRRLESDLPDAYATLLRAGRTLEADAADVQDIEFTVQSGRLFLLQSRTAKRSPEAAVRIAVELADAGTITDRQAVARVTADQVRQILRPSLADGARADAEVLATGIAACPGVGTGIVVRSPAEVVERAKGGGSVVFVAESTSPSDIDAMIAAVAVVTGTGGSTSHAAVVCRGLGRPAVVGSGPGVTADLPGRTVTVDGGSGHVYSGALPLHAVDPAGDRWLRELAVRAEALAPVRAVRPDDPVPGPVTDLDALGVVDPADVPADLPAVGAVRGAVLDTDAGVVAAVAAGARVIVTAQPLPALLAALAAADPEESR